MNITEEWREHLRKIGKKGGKKVHKKYGSEHFSALGKIGNKKKWKNKEV